MRTAPALLISALLLGSLSGCFESSPRALPDPEPSASPVFASEEEALAAAEEAYGDYSRVSDQVLMDGGENPERLIPFVTEQHYVDSLEGLALYRDNGWRSSSETSYDSVVLQQVVEHTAGATVIVYMCLDVSAARIIDSSGADVTPPGGVTRVPVEVRIDFRDANHGLVAGSELWDGSDFCD